MSGATENLANSPRPISDLIDPRLGNDDPKTAGWPRIESSSTSTVSGLLVEALDRRGVLLGSFPECAGSRPRHLPSDRPSQRREGPCAKGQDLTSQ
jgi:hypothetical protein